jgi:hypothetical protein
MPLSGTTMKIKNFLDSLPDKWQAGLRKQG